MDSSTWKDMHRVPMAADLINSETKYIFAGEHGSVSCFKVGTPLLEEKKKILCHRYASAA